MTTMTYKKKYVSTTNACKLCRPLGAMIAFRGIEGAVPFLHGSQGCATYMRRYIISHFNEPIDIASSSLGEKNAIYGGGANIKQGLSNVINKFQPSLVGIATTCLTETIGDDVHMLLHQFCAEAKGQTLPEMVHVSTPSYDGTHIEGFHGAVRAAVDSLATAGHPSETVNLLPGFISPADIRYLQEIMADFALPTVILPDISDTLDGPALRKYEMIPGGGTTINEIKSMGTAQATIEFGRTVNEKLSSGLLLNDRFDIPCTRLGLPMGLRETDLFFAELETISGKTTPEKYSRERGRYVDSFVDGHKYVFGKRAIVYGEEDFVVGLTALLVEFGIKPVLCASGGKSGKLTAAIAAVSDDILKEQPLVREGMDFFEIAEEAESLAPDLLIGHSKGYPLAKKLNIPLLRVGFPVHDRLGGQRILHLGYRGAQMLFDQIVNSVIEQKQDSSSVGYSYM